MNSSDLQDQLAKATDMGKKLIKEYFSIEEWNEILYPSWSPRPVFPRSSDIRAISPTRDVAKTAFGPSDFWQVW